MSARVRIPLVAVATLLAIALLAWARGGAPDLAVEVPAGGASAAATGATSASATPGRPTRADLTIVISDLPAEAIGVIEQIEAGGPYAFTKDGTVFGNREQLLPLRQRGYYQEYTVPTPGSPDRGARRIVAGGGGELYYTDDHYQSFRLIMASS